MQRVLVLVDFTEGSVIAFKQAEQLAVRTNAELHAVHICANKDQTETSASELRGFVYSNSDNPYNIQCAIGVGTVMDAAPEMIRKIDPNVVILCTHGITGISQHLFGAKILKLAQAIRYPMIIIQENNKVNMADLKTILFPLGPHTAFESKIRETAKFAKELGASIVMYEIEGPPSTTDDYLNKNKKAASAHFSEMKIDARYVFEEPRFVSVGFSRQTIAYASENHFDMISLMTTISNNDTRFASGDKESLVINKIGIPVFLSPE